MKYHYILFNKPYGVLSQFTDEGTGHPTLKLYIKTPGVYSAGRLDRDSEGLLLLTNDGDLINRLTDPVRHLEKTYLVQVEGEPTPEKLEKLRQGVIIRKNHLTMPCEIRSVNDPGLQPRSKPVTPHGPVSWLEIKLHEGKKRQIRQMTASVGLFTLRLIRIAIGSLTLDGIEPGQYRLLSETEIRRLNEAQ